MIRSVLKLYMSMVQVYLHIRDKNERHSVTSYSVTSIGMTCMTSCYGVHFCVEWVNRPVPKTCKVSIRYVSWFTRYSTTLIIFRMTLVCTCHVFILFVRHGFVRLLTTIYHLSAWGRAVCGGSLGSKELIVRFSLETYIFILNFSLLSAHLSMGSSCIWNQACHTLPSINNYTHTKFDIHFQDSLNLN